MSYPNPDERPSYPPQDIPRTSTDERVRPMHEDHRRTTQRTPLSRTSTWSAVFLMGGWRLALALVLIFFIFVTWALLGSRTDGAVTPVATDAPALTTPQATLYPTMTVAAGEQVRVSGTGTSGLYLRKEPSRTSEVLKTLPEGTVLSVIGANKTMDDVVWRNVRDAAGSDGWVAADFVVPNQ